MRPPVQLVSDSTSPLDESDQRQVRGGKVESHEIVAVELLHRNEPLHSAVPVNSMESRSDLHLCEVKVMVPTQEPVESISIDMAPSASR